jgi:hypothetical protein
MDFKFQIGDRVTSKTLLETQLVEMQHSNLTPRMGNLYVEERHSVECAGGVQLFYGCRTVDGMVWKFPEAVLMPGLEAFEQWIEAFVAQQDRLKKLI